jgi:hypothetical protein
LIAGSLALPLVALIVAMGRVPLPSLARAGLQSIFPGATTHEAPGTTRPSGLTAPITIRGRSSTDHPGAQAVVHGDGAAPGRAAVTEKHVSHPRAAAGPGTGPVGDRIQRPRPVTAAPRTVPVPHEAPPPSTPTRSPAPAVVTAPPATGGVGGSVGGRATAGMSGQTVGLRSSTTIGVDGATVAGDGRPDGRTTTAGISVVVPKVGSVSAGAGNDDSSTYAHVEASANPATVAVTGSGPTSGSPAADVGVSASVGSASGSAEAGTSGANVSGGVGTTTVGADVDPGEGGSVQASATTGATTVDVSADSGSVSVTTPAGSATGTVPSLPSLPPVPPLGSGGQDQIASSQDQNGSGGGGNGNGGLIGGLP